MIDLIVAVFGVKRLCKWFGVEMTYPVGSTYVRRKS